jgi:hypothetical protein
MAIREKQHIAAYVTEPSFTSSRKHRKRAVVSSTKARNIFTNRTKKEKSHQSSPVGQKKRNPTNLHQSDKKREIPPIFTSRTKKEKSHQSSPVGQKNRNPTNLHQSDKKTEINPSG